MKRTMIGLAAMGLFLAGCSGGDDSTAVSSSVSASATTELPMSGLQEYQTVQAIRADLGKGGVVCSDIALRPGMYAVQMGGCIVQGDGQEIVLSTFADEPSQRQAESALAELGNDIGGYGFVSGGNWLVNCGNKAMCLDVQAVLGGRAEYPI